MSAGELVRSNQCHYVERDVLIGVHIVFIGANGLKDVLRGFQVGEESAVVILLVRVWACTDTPFCRALTGHQFPSILYSNEMRSWGKIECYDSCSTISFYANYAQKINE